MLNPIWLLSNHFYGIILCFIKTITVSVTGLTDDNNVPLLSQASYFIVIIGIHVIVVVVVVV